MLAFVTVLCVAVGWNAELARRQLAGVEWVRNYGGYVVYDHERPAHYGPACMAEPQWLRDLIGVDFFHNVVAVSLNHNEVEDLAPVASLRSLTSLGISAAVNPDVDVSVLCALSQLKELHLNYTGIKQDRLKPVREALPACRIISETDPTIVWPLIGD
jgi:hypothetical protein